MNPSKSSLIEPKRTQNITLVSPKDSQSEISPLVANYMKLFDQQNLTTNLLHKRQNPALNDSIQDEIQKKLKTSLLSSGFTNPAVPNLLSPLFQQQPLFLPQNTGGSLKEINDLVNVMKLQRLQNLSAFLGMQQPKPELFTGLPLLMNNALISPTNEKISLTEEKTQKLKENILIKEGLLQEKTESSPLSNLSKRSVNKKLHNIPAINSGESLKDAPVLCEFTRTFPEWDLSTIFNYLRSGKSRDEFEKDKKPKVTRQRKSNHEKVKTVGVKSNKILGEKVPCII